MTKQVIVNGGLPPQFTSWASLYLQFVEGMVKDSFLMKNKDEMCLLMPGMRFDLTYIINQMNK